MVFEIFMNIHHVKDGWNVKKSKIRKNGITRINAKPNFRINDTDHFHITNIVVHYILHGWYTSR